MVPISQAFCFSLPSKYILAHRSFLFGLGRGNEKKGRESRAGRERKGEVREEKECMYVCVHGGGESYRVGTQVSVNV